MIITLTGENTYAAHMAERALVDAFVAEHGANGVEKTDGEELDVARLPDLLQGATLFAPVRLVILKNIAASKTLHEPLVEMLAGAADTSTIVIADSTLDKRTKLYKFLKTKSDFQNFAALDEPQLTAWVQQQARRTDADITKTDALFLARRAGHDQWRLHQEIEKLAGYQPQIQQGIIESLVEPSGEGTAFELLDAALSGHGDQVSRRIAALKTEEDPYKLFGLLASQVYALAVILAAGSRSPDQVAKAAGLHPFVVRKSQPVVQRLGPVRVRRVTKEVADCDWLIKTTGVDPWYALEMTLQKIAVHDR